MSLYLLIVTIVVPDVTIFIYLLSVRDLTSIFEVPYIIYNVQFLSSSYMKTSLFWTAATTLLLVIPPTAPFIVPNIKVRQIPLSGV